MNGKTQSLAARVRQLRAGRGWTLRDAAGATRVSRSMLSNIERGAASPTAAVLGKLAGGFGISISQLLGGPSASPRRAQPVRLASGAQTVFRDPASGFERRSLSPARRGRSVDLVVNRLPPRQSSGLFPPHRPGVEETLHVAAGRLLLILGRRRLRLERGDSVLYRADVGHRFENPSASEPAVFYIAIDNTRAA